MDIFATLRALQTEYEKQLSGSHWKIIREGTRQLIETDFVTPKGLEENLTELLKDAADNNIKEIRFDGLVKAVEKTKKGTPFSIDSIICLIAEPEPSIILYVVGKEIKKVKDWESYYTNLFGMKSYLCWIKEAKNDKS